MKKRSKKIKASLIAVSVVMIIPVFFAMWSASYVMDSNRQTLDEAFEWQSEHYDTSFYSSLEKSDYIIKSYDGYDIHAQFLKNPEKTNKYIIITHGHTDNRMGSLKYAKMYLSLGFSCIIYDMRGHGENSPTFTTYGIREGHDIAEVVKDTRSRFKDISVLGLHGEPLGAASPITSLKYSPDVDFAVADCGFSDIENVLHKAYRDNHVPAFLIGLTDIGARIRYNYSLKDMRPIDSLSENKVPILFIHGADDDLILPENSENMAKKNPARSVLYLIDGAGHA